MTSLKWEQYNVIATVTDKPEEPYLIIGAHYDSCYHTPGADDNASAVAVMLETARISAVTGKDPKNLMFVAYTLEEPPYFYTKNMGSDRHVKALKDKGKKVELMTCLEMLGYFTDKENSQEYPTLLKPLGLPEKGNFVAVVAGSKSKKQAQYLDWVIRKAAEMPAEYASVSAYVHQGGLSDHINYWQKGYLAVMLTDTAFMRNKNYHKVTDTPDTLSYDKMAKICRALAFYIIGKEKALPEKNKLSIEK
ncbi:MAG: M28 family peptidase [Lentisphaerae bacterium]|nr:M28 family peptidase [Lentisphaerota bacterium]MCP4099912.1 M28 family peptidase [Lentisphaerota bacterium]